MASLGCLRLHALFAGCAAVFPVLAMQPLDEQSLSEVTGQAQGLRYTSEYDARIDSISYIDDDGLGNGNVGTLTLSPVRLYTQTNRPVQIDLEVKEVNGRKALVFTNRDLPIETEIGSFAVNGYSLGESVMAIFRLATVTPWLPRSMPAVMKAMVLPLIWTFPALCRLTPGWKMTVRA